MFAACPVSAHFAGSPKQNQRTNGNQRASPIQRNTKHHQRTTISVLLDSVAIGFASKLMALLKPTASHAQDSSSDSESDTSSSSSESESESSSEEEMEDTDARAAIGVSQRINGSFFGTLAPKHSNRLRLDPQGPFELLGNCPVRSCNDPETHTQSIR